MVYDKHINNAWVNFLTEIEIIDFPKVFAKFDDLTNLLKTEPFESIETSKYNQGMLESEKHKGQVMKACESWYLGKLNERFNP